MAVALPASAHSQAGAPGAPEPYVVEYYYKVKWGYQSEFIELFRKNHYPVLKREMERGIIQEVTGTAPRYHGTEDVRWDYRVTIVFKSVAAAHAPAMTEEELRKIFPDKVTFEKEEQRRFELLEAHWDLPLVAVRLPR
ncbi:MAG: hypothetical protein H7Z74_08830 [Anaerolineae bacterium]|nr:hypothetical protein [Gemmatimonadaceae bacterium]